MMNEKIGLVELDYFGEQPGSIYSEGNEIEERVLQVFKDGEDPLEVLKRDNRWPILYQLSPARGNIILPMRLDKSMSVLELGSGMGAVTTALAPRCGTVDCVDMSKVRCLANAYRNRSMNNIRIHIGDIMQYSTQKRYDAILLIGVLEYASEYSNSEKPFYDMLKLCYRFLKPNGLLYIAIENRLGAKYLAGCREDHIGRWFVGVEGYQCTEKPRTFSRSELLDIVRETGFGSPFFYYPLPDYKLPIVIYSDDLLPGKMLNIPRDTNYDAERLYCFDEVMALKSLQSSEEFKMLANSFLLEVKREADREA